MLCAPACQASQGCTVQATLLVGSRDLKTQVKSVVMSLSVLQELLQVPSDQKSDE